MELRTDADSRAMEVAGAPPSAHIPARFADPEDPPRELSGWKWGVLVSLGVLTILSLIRLVVAVDLNSTAGEEGDVIAAYDTYSVWSGLHALLSLLAAGVFIAWFFQAYKNLRRLGVHNMRYGNGWAIGAWFIPIFNLFRPKQIANDIWRGSERGVDVATQWRQVAVPSLLHWWWGLFLAQNILTQVGQGMVESGHDKLVGAGSFSSGLSQIESGTVVDILGGVCTIAAAFLAIKVVSRISDRLDEVRNDVLG